ncbi:MAG: SDR family NAD(P)-dependent oxidoreductase [Proteobacteria bacterium]|nr:SDR family NAD(P)-dependent oxidoreductase [Pseudomonadota bacterium]
MEVADKVVVVTGAGSGIGRAFAIKCAEIGATMVVCTDLNGANAEETAKMIGAGARGVVLDVGDEAAINSLVAEVEQTNGGIDVFVSNAGYGQPGGLDLATPEWERMMRVHTWSHLAAARAVIPGMVARGGGYLLNTASAAGLLTQMDSGPYAVSKHAAVAFAEWVAINYYDRGIRVSVLCPQAVRTNIGANSRRNPTASAPRPKIGQASFDGVLEADAVALACLDAMREERFLVLPHPEVETYFQRKANDYDRWLHGMRRFRDRLKGG